MNINKISAVAAIICGVLSTNVSMAETGTITINGEVTDTSCQVPAAQLTQTIDVGIILPSALDSAAADASVVNRAFQFDVTNCPASTSSVGVQFAFTPDATNGQYMANNGDATGVLLGVTNDSDALISTGETINADDLNASQGTATVKAKVHAYRVGTDPSAAGTIDSTATVTLIAQ